MIWFFLLTIKDDNEDSDNVKTLDKNFEEKYFKGKLIYFFSQHANFSYVSFRKRIAFWFFNEDYK